MKKVRTVRPRPKGDRLDPRAVVVGVTVGEAARAYPFPLLRQQSPVVDRLGGYAIVLVVGDDKKSIRVFKTTVEDRALSFAAKAGVRPLRLVDAETASEWDFSGRAISGPLEGRQLEKVYALKEYWFDWKTYHPKTGLYTAGLPPLPSRPKVPRRSVRRRPRELAPRPHLGIHSPQSDPGRLLHALAPCGSPRLRRRRPTGATSRGRRHLHAFPENLKARQWFEEARFGLFVHWGVYSVLGDGEWVMNNRKIKVAEYEKLPALFNPQAYDPAEWVALVKAAGMKYITITSKHHDGFAMWDSEGLRLQHRQAHALRQGRR